MANNFRVDIINRHSTDLFLRIIGDFDGSSAYRLTNLMKKEGIDFRKIVVDTNGLKEVYPFGRDIFRNNIKDITNKGVNVSFLGRFKSVFE